MTVSADKRRANQTQRLAGARPVWTEIRRLRIFRCNELMALTGVPRSAVASFLHRALQAGLLIIVEQPSRQRDAAVYQLVRDVGRRCPRFRADGTIDPTPTPSERMWAAIKPLRGGFTTSELASLARVKSTRSARYITALRKHGYLELLTRYSGGASPAEARYRLNKTMNTGPDAPQVLRDGAVWDPNREAMADEVTE